MISLICKNLLKTHKNQTDNREHISDCQRQGEGAKEMWEGGQNMQTFIYKINKF